MTTEDAYFFDTYAVLEVIKGSANYRPYFNCGVILTKLNLFEVCHAFIRIGEREKALFYMKQYEQFVVDFDENDILMAAVLKSQNRNLSMTDCIGYIVSVKSKSKFLTGDKEFSNMPNVEFVK